MVAIGFSGSKVSLDRLPGWEPDSWAYHGDDGKSYCCQIAGKNYGPQFTVGDTIGCGINFRTKTAFFTKNGVDLGALIMV
jgi:Ran-binding protein 9/10